jgi:protein-tyrosine kinase
VRALNPFLSRLRAVLRTRWRLALGLAVAGALAAAALGAAIPERYTATAQVLVGAVGGGAAGPLDGPLPSAGALDVQADIVSSGRVALKVVDALGLADDPAVLARWRREAEGRGSARHFAADRLRARLSVARGGAEAGGGAVLSIAFAGDDPAGAARTANAFARAYGETLDEIRADAARRQVDTPARMRGFDGVGAVLLDPASEPVRTDRPSAAVLAAGAALVGLLLGLAGALVAEMRRPRVRSLADLRHAVGAVPAEQLSDASASGRVRMPSRAADAPGRRPIPDNGVETRVFAPPAAMAAPGSSAPARDREPAAAAAPGAGGHRGAAGQPGPAEPARQPIGQLLVQAGLMHPPEVERTLAWARDEGLRFGEAAIARRLVTPAQLERVLAVQFDYPLLERGGSAVSDEVVAAFDAGLPAAADLRRLRARLDLKAFGPGTTRCLAVVAPGLDVGRSFVAANLAVSLAQAGRRVLLIDADLRRGRLHEVFGSQNRSGLSTMLNGRIEAAALQRIAGLRELTLIACGPPAPNPSELLSREVFAHLLSSFRRAYDAVILDTGDLSGEPDALLVARQAGSALLVARCDGTPMGVLRGAVRLLHDEGVALAAVVLDRH